MRQRPARTQAELPVPLALEPIAALFDWPDDELTEARLPHRDPRPDRRAAAARRRQRVRQRPQPRRPTRSRCWTALPLERVAYVHVAGGAEHDGLYHDTHTDPVPPAVLELVERAVRADRRRRR